MAIKVIIAVLVLFHVMPVILSAEEGQKAKDGETEEVVVTATRIEAPSREVGSSVTVITGKKIEESRKTTVLELLRTVPSLDVVQTGGEGSATSIFIRGARSEDTLVLLDGMEMNDPISTGRTYNFANLTVDNVERIEIIRGPQSTLYGSDAIGGVVNIITKRGKGKPSYYISGEGGSFNTFKESAGVSGGSDKVNYSVGISRLDTGGISGASEKDGNSEKDGYKNSTVSMKLGFTPSENLDFDFIARYIDARTDIDNFGGAGGDDPNNTDDSRQLYLRTQARLSLYDDLWEQTLGFSISDHKRVNNNDTDAQHPNDLVRSSFDAQLIKLDWQHNLYLHETNTLTVGFENEEENGKSDFYSESSYGPYSSSFGKKTAVTTSYYLQDLIKLRDSFFTTLGVRLDDHTKFGSQTTYRITSAYIIKRTETKLKGSYGTGFKAPSLFQLYSQYGDENLSPGESKGWDVGIEQSLFNNRLTMGASYFNNEFDNLIEFESGTLMYRNVAKAVSSGAEIFTSVRPFDDVTIGANYTYTDTEDKATGKALLRRPMNKFSLNAGYRFRKKVNINAGLIYVGERDDNDYSTYPATRVTLGGYTLVNLVASYRISRRFELFWRVENLFNTEYEEVKGFGTPGVSSFGGVKLLL